MLMPMLPNCVNGCGVGSRLGSRLGSWSGDCTSRNPCALRVAGFVVGAAGFHNAVAFWTCGALFAFSVLVVVHCVCSCWTIPTLVDTGSGLVATIPACGASAPLFRFAAT